MIGSTNSTAVNFSTTNSLLDSLEQAVGIYPSTYYNLTYQLSGCESDDYSSSLEENSSYQATITPETDYTLDNATVEILMDNVNITSAAYIYDSLNDLGTVYIPDVTGDVEITITAVYNGGL